MEPYLKKTSEPLAYYENIKGCGLSCQDPSFKVTETNQFKENKKWVYSPTLIVHLFMCVTLFGLTRQSKQDEIGWFHSQAV